MAFPPKLTAVHMHKESPWFGKGVFAFQLSIIPFRMALLLLLNFYLCIFPFSFPFRNIVGFQRVIYFNHRKSFEPLCKLTFLTAYEILLFESPEGFNFFFSGGSWALLRERRLHGCLESIYNDFKNKAATIAIFRSYFSDHPSP